MTMGKAKITRLNEHEVNREPQQPLNAFIKGNLLMLLKRDDVFVALKRSPGSDLYIVKDFEGTELFRADNAWDYGYYVISAKDVVLAEMDWYENDNHTNRAQQDIFDVLHAVGNKYQETRGIEEARKNMSPAEARLVQAWNARGNNGK